MDSSTDKSVIEMVYLMLVSSLSEGCGFSGKNLKERPQELYEGQKQGVQSRFSCCVEVCEKDT